MATLLLPVMLLRALFPTATLNVASPADPKALTPIATLLLGVSPFEPPAYVPALEPINVL